MKYCKKCKIAAKESDLVCSKCKGELSSFGSKSQPAAGAKAGPAPAAAKPATTGPSPSPSRPTAGRSSPPPQKPPQPPPVTAGTPPPAAKIAFTLSGQIAELEQIKEKNLKRGRSFGFLSALIALIIMILLYTVYSRTVLAYAVLENIEFVQDPVAESQITVSFDVKTPGKVAFDRRSGDSHTEKLDLIAETGHRTMGWAWPSEPRTGIDFSVVSRGGWFRTSTDRHFNVTRSDVGVDVVFLMDVTSSMQPYIEDLKQECIDFARQIRRGGTDCRLGLIGFGDVDINEPITVFKPNADAAKFQRAVANLDLTQGGDAPESSIEAIERAMELDFRPHTRICFVHITDAPCHHRERIPELASSLKENQVVTYVISDRRLRALYSPLCVNGGSFYGISREAFASILKDVAKSISNQIKSD